MGCLGFLDFFRQLVDVAFKANDDFVLPRPRQVLINLIDLAREVFALSGQIVF